MNPDRGNQIQSIGVIGGGSAGFLTALYLRQALPQVHLTLIESTRVPVIGVGEATTPLLLDFLHRRLGFALQEFYQEAKPTIKLGIHFDWGKPGDGYHFNTTFGPADLLNAVVHTGEFNNLSFPSLLMEAGRTPFARTGKVSAGANEARIEPLSLSRGYAYHVDNKHFLGYLKRKLVASGCRYVDTEIDSVECTPGRAAVAALHGTDGVAHRFDLYIDCTGFRSLLLEKALGAEWVDYSSSLKTDRAVLGTRPNHGAIAPYTSSTTMRHGWLWNTPMQQEDHLGYVFSSAHCSDDEALDELRIHCTQVNEQRVVHFKPGRHSESWRANVVAVGNSFAFIEPLQSTGLHMVLRQLRSLAKALSAGQTNDAAVMHYNAETNRSWDHLRWFVAMHFRYNFRLDTAFWRACHAEVDVSGLSEYLGHYAEHGPLAAKKDHPLNDTVAIDDIFSVYAHDAILTGCGVNEDFFRTQAHAAEPQWPFKLRLQQMLRDQCLGHRETLQHMEITPYAFLQEVRTPS